MQNYRDLKVWQRSHALVLAIYKISKSFPDDERFTLTSQLRRAAISVPTNIAEGSKRRHNIDYARFLNIAEGSLAETDYLIFLSGDLGYISSDTVASIRNETDEISRMLHGLTIKVEDNK